MSRCVSAFDRCSLLNTVRRANELAAPSFLNLPQYHVLTVAEDEHDYHVYVEVAKPVRVCHKTAAP
jgi:hypothetical protein